MQAISITWWSSDRVVLSLLQEADKPEKRKQVPWIMVVIHRPLHNNPPTTGVLGPIK